MNPRVLGLAGVTVAIGLVVVLMLSRPDPTSSDLPKSDGRTVRYEDWDGAVDPTPTRRYKIGVLFPFLAAPFWVNEAYGVLDQAKKLGVDIVWLSADGYGNVVRQNAQIDDLVVQRVDAILLAATSYSGTAVAVDRAAAAGVPVFTHVTSSESKRVVSAVLDDDPEIGRKQARFMGQALSGRGRIAMLNGPAGAEWSMRRVEGFKDVLRNEFPGVEIVAEREGIPDRSDAKRLAEDLFVAFSELDGVFTVADGMAMGVVDAAQAAHRVDKLIVTTASFSRETVPFLQKKYIDVNVDENPVLLGRIAVNIVVRALNGEIVPSVVLVPNPEITAGNLDSVDPAVQWAPMDWRMR